MMHLCFGYELEDTHGWARATVTVGDASHVLTHGYVTNPLGQIASIAVVLARGQGLPRTEVIFDDEPAGHIASFVHRDPTSFELRFFRDVSRRHPAEGEIIARHDVNSVVFAVSVGETLHRIFREQGMTGFLKNWGLYSFPFLQYWYLRLLLDQSEAIDRLTAVSNSSRGRQELEILAAEPQWATVRLENRSWVELPRDIDTGSMRSG